MKSMGRAKGAKKETLKTENPPKVWNIEDPINTTQWKCVVTMAVERSRQDNFVLKIFNEESSKGCRQEVSVIDYDTLVLKILSDFAKGELPYKYAFLLNFSSVFREAVDFINKRKTIPVPVLVKVVKALLFYLKEESLIKIEKLEAGSPDPIEAMATRPTTFGNVEVKKKEVTKKGDNEFTVRPPSVTKQDTELLKRGERAKDDQRIDDAPQNAYFHLYVLLTGFYHPDLPLELIKAGIPLHSIICIDTSSSGVTSSPSTRRKSVFTKNWEAKAMRIQTFWSAFLKIVWNPEFSHYFKDTIFQMYVPRRLLCDKNQLREFIYREISYLMYEMSDLKRQLNNYLDHMQLWDVTGTNFQMSNSSLESKTLPNECMSVPMVLQYIIDEVCKNDSEIKSSSKSSFSLATELDQFVRLSSPSLKSRLGSCEMGQKYSQEFKEKGKYTLLSVFYKIEELDEKYDLNNKSISSVHSEKEFIDTDTTTETCNYQPLVCGDNMEEALSLGGTFRAYWKKYQVPQKLDSAVDYCLYPLFMTKVFCSFQSVQETSSIRSNLSIKKNSYFEFMDNLNNEIRNPHFTVTEGSRSILKSVPYNVKNFSRDFFCPKELKIVSPEKLKAGSAPEFRVTSRLKVQATFTSEIFPAEISKNPFESLRGFVNECVFLNTNNFDFLEFLNKSKLFEKEHEYWNKYNCIDHTYSPLTDSIFFMLHNRKDSQNIHYETFNEMLRTAVGLRDFYDYVMEDEAEWLARQEENYQAAAMLANKMLDSDSFRNFSDKDFWLLDSLKYCSIENQSNEDVIDEVKTEYSSMEELDKTKVQTFNSIGYIAQSFEGYNVSDMSVQFSGLKSVYYLKDCSVTVHLIERLYGSQDLGVHLSVDSHTLHLYSYVCPEPHILDPFTFHVTYKNGIIVAFERRWIENFEEIEEVIESRTQIKGKKNSSELSTRIVKKQISKTVTDEEFFYDMAMSLPNGLSIRAVRRIVKPCYIKQFFLAKTEEISQLENARLFLPNGNVIKMMSDDTVQIFKIDASIVTAYLSDLISNEETGYLNFFRFQVVSGDGYKYEYEQGEVTSSKRFQIFQNTDVNTGQIYFRRRDGTNYLLENDGTFIVQFKDGTKMSTSVTAESSKISQSSDKLDQFSESEFEADIVMVHMKIIIEHPDYATVIYDTQTQIWKLLLPFNSTISVHTDGHYSVDIDKQTELIVQKDLITMNRFSSKRNLNCVFTADLSVFEKPENKDYCLIQDSTGKTFVVKANSNCYPLGEEALFQNNSSEEIQPRESDLSEFVASADLQICPPIQPDKGNMLSFENKYFVVKRDMTGAEVLHVDDVIKTLTEREKGSLVFIQNIPGTKNRCFVLITPKTKKKIKKWEVDSILPNPKYEPNSSKKTFSSTYGVPPSWMHPFPKQKIPFVIPEPLTCRVFVETKNTEFSPQIGVIDCYNCEMSEDIEIKHTIISPEGVEEYLKRLSNDNQDILKEMYAIVASSLLNEKKKMKPINTKKLERYLEMSKYLVEKREYHKACIRYHIVPNYFRHPAGMSWLILNDLILGLNLPSKEPKAEVKLKKVPLIKARTSDRLTSDYSDEEIEYNLSISAGQSFSDLSWRSNLSAQTAPAILRTGGVGRCKVKPVKFVASAATVKCYWEEQTVEESSKEPFFRVCDFQQSDFDLIEKTEHEEREITPTSLEDLMYLGLV